MTSILNKASQYFYGIKNAAYDFTRDYPKMTKAAVIAGNLFCGYMLYCAATDYNVTVDCKPIMDCVETIQYACKETNVFNTVFDFFVTEEPFAKPVIECTLQEDCTTRNSLPLQELFMQAPYECALGLIGLGALAKKGVSTFNNYALSRYHKRNAWEKAAIGASYYPMAITAGLAAQYALITAEPSLRNTFMTIHNRCLANTQQMISAFIGFNSPVPIEEFIFRILIQDLFLKKTLFTCLQKIFPRMDINSMPQKALRIAISSIIFSAAHLTNLSISTQEDVTLQLGNTLSLGIILGFLQEEVGDGWASLGLHSAFNSMGALKLSHCANSR